jgi:hypothetical protein
MFFTPDLDRLCNAQPYHTPHHWNALSEPYAVTSQLAHFLQQGWQVSNLVIRKTCYFSGGRSTHLYYFELRRSGTYMTMPVQDSPTLKRLLFTHPFEVKPYREQRFTVLEAKSNSVGVSAS